MNMIVKNFNLILMLALVASTNLLYAGKYMKFEEHENGRQSDKDDEAIIGKKAQQQEGNQRSSIRERQKERRMEEVPKEGKTKKRY